MNKLACKILWWQGVVLVALALARLIAWLAGFQRELLIVELDTACCLAFAALSMALSRTRLCGLSPWLATLSSVALGCGFLITGFLLPGASLLVGVIGPQMAFVALATMTGGVLDCKQEAGKRMDKPLRVAGLLLATYVLARFLMNTITVTWFTTARSPVVVIRNHVFEILLLFLSAAGVMLSLSTLWPKASTALSFVLAGAFLVGSVLLAGALSEWYVGGISRNVLLGTVSGVVLLFPSFLRRFSGKR
jgi:hypothetical protein